MLEIVVNELMCYVWNNFGKYPKDLMIWLSKIIGMFNDDLLRV